MSTELRIGCLGAARIAPRAIVQPARKLEGVELAAVAARDPERARKFASKHGIPTVHQSYDALLADPTIDAIYNPLPNSLHALWTLRAIEAGKHVLCEKPFTANAGEAERVASAAAPSGLVVMEAFHWRYHPLAERLRDIIRSGELGEIRHIDAWMCFPLLSRSDIRWQLDLAGGTLMDAGCYAVHLVRTLAGEEPEVVRAVARLRAPEVDRRMEADLRVGDRTARIVTSMWSRTLLKVAARVVGDRGEMRVLNPFAPQYFHRITINAGGTKRRERIRGESTYSCQLAAFVAAIATGEPPLTGTADAVANMRAVDAIYSAAGLEPRRGATDG